jgi:hypothetical protein
MTYGAKKFITAFFVFVLMVIAIQAADQRGQNLLKSQAVERGFAEWVSDYNGNTTFVWKEPTKE